jgi:phage shock protein C
MVIRRSSEKHGRSRNRYGRTGSTRRSPRGNGGHQSIEGRVDDFFELFVDRLQTWLDGQKGTRKLASKRQGSSYSGRQTDYEFHRGDRYDDVNDGDDDVVSAETSQGASDADAEEVTAGARARAYHRGRSGSRRKRYGIGNRKKRGHLYRDRSQKKIAGVCAGIAGHLGIDTWKIRALAVVGLFLMPSVVFTSYWFLYFVLDDKPFYKQVTDRFPDLSLSAEKEPMRKRNSGNEPPVNHAHTLRRVKQLFADNEDKLRVLEAFITSPRFELNRAFREMDARE